MKKLSLLLLFAVSFFYRDAMAQPTFCLSPSQIVVDENGIACFNVTVVDFTDILAVQFSLNWDPGVLESPTISMLNGNVTGLNTGDFNFSQQDNGILTFDWNNGLPCNTATTGVTLPDNAILFKICFTATGIYGNHSPVEITGDPLDTYVTRLNANCNDIGMFVKNGFISVGTSPVTVNISSADGYTNEIVCLDFEVDNFDDVLAMQFAVHWDPNLLLYQSASTSNLPQFTTANLGLTQTDMGLLNVSWNTINTNCQTLPDGQKILSICFKILGTCGQTASVFIDENPPLPVEIINCTSGQGLDGVDIGLLQQEGTVTVSCFNPDGIGINIPDKDVCPGEMFTVDVTVEDFENVSKLLFNLEWNSDVIQLVAPKVTYPQAGCFAFQTPSVVDQTQSNNGIINVDYTNSATGCDLPDGRILLRLHFKAIGPSGSNTNISVTNPIFVDIFGGQQLNVGINNNNGLVSICDLTSLTIVAGSASADPGETVCIDFTVESFEDIERMQYSITWEPNVLEYIGVDNLNLPDLTVDNFYDGDSQSFGILGVEWESGSGETVPDGSVIFTACFNVIGDPTECTAISFEDLPYPIDIITSQSNDTNVGLNGQPGSVCTTNPLAFEVSIIDLYAAPTSTACLDVTATNFTQLTNLEFTLDWDPGTIQFDTIMAADMPNFNASSYDAALTDDGLLSIDWASANQFLGSTLTDGSALFTVCFLVTGNESDCSPVTLTQSPASIVVNSAPTGNANLGLTQTGGSVCVSASLHLEDAIVTDVDCPTSPNGAINITVEGGSGSYQFDWSGAGVAQNSEDQNGLGVGIYDVTVTDVQNPTLTMELAYSVGFSATATVASAGADTTFSCDNFFLTLNGSGSSAGPNYSYSWTALDGGLVLPGEANKMSPQVIGGQLYQLVVVNSATNCIATDQVEIDAPLIPVPAAGDSVFASKFNCLTDTLELDGSLSPFGFDVEWTTTGGGSIVPGTENNLITQVTASGWYYLTQSDPQTNCFGVDSIFVEEDFVEPTAAAGDDQILGCNDVSQTLDGSGSSTGADFTYEWSPIGLGEICGDISTSSTTACAAGFYQLIVTNEANGCTKLDVVQVTADIAKPEIAAGDSITLTCPQPESVLQGQIISGSGDYGITWAFTAGGNISLGQGTLTPTVTAGATYTLTVVDNANGCESISDVVVAEDKDEPLVVVTDDGDITCANGDVLLQSTGSSVGAEFSYEWIYEATTVVGSDTSLTVTLSGSYELVISNTENGCTHSELVIVDDDTDLPPVNAGNDATLGCVPESIQLSGSTAPNILIQWSGTQGCITNANSPTPTIECPGEYVMNVLNQATGCVNSDAVTISDGTAPPVVSADTAAHFNCTTDELQLNGSAPTTGVTIVWTSIPSGLPITDPGSLTPTVTEVGVYVMLVTDNNTGCTGEAFVTVDNGGVTYPNADAGAPDTLTLDCVTPLATLNASNSTLDNTTITWTALQGTIDPSVIHDVNIEVGIGVYELTIAYTGTGCASKDTVAILPDNSFPEANPGSGYELGCTDETVTLTGSSDVAGALFTWEDSVGNIVASGASADVNAPGEYTLTVFNPANNCESSNSTTVESVVDGEPADAQADSEPCTDEAMLIGNLPGGATGVWTTADGAVITDPAAATTLATGLLSGENVFTWTLSLGSCVEYSTANITVIVESAQSAPDAHDDIATLTPDLNGVISLNVLNNDDFSADSVVFSVLGDPFSGSVTSSADGALIYRKVKCFEGEVEIPYSICSITCPDLCDTASVLITVELDETEGCDDVPNGVTPNGDGVNDELVFDIIETTPSGEIPDNELIIFNRWGDIIYTAKPYMNDWKGTASNGKELPHATYYYILRLNIGEGLIIRGDVTILK